MIRLINELWRTVMCQNDEQGRVWDEEPHSVAIRASPTAVLKRLFAGQLFADNRGTITRKDCYSCGQLVSLRNNVSHATVAER